MVLLGKTQGKRPLGKPRRRWEDNIKMYRQEVGCGGMYWIKLPQDRDRWRAIVNGVMNLQGPYNVGNTLLPASGFWGNITGMNKNRSSFINNILVPKQDLNVILNTHQILDFDWCGCQGNNKHLLLVI